MDEFPVAMFEVDERVCWRVVPETRLGGWRTHQQPFPLCEPVSNIGECILFRFYCWLGVCLGIALMGCDSGGPSTVICTNPQQSKTWLLGEVDKNIEDATEGVFRFPLYNGTRSPVQIRVRSIECSCYAVRRGETRLQVGDLFELGAGQTETLTLRPPRPTIDRASDYQFTVEYEPAPAAPPEVISCQGTLVSIAEYRVNPGLLSAEFTKDTPPQTVRMEITCTGRDPQAMDSAPLVQGWPDGTQAEVPASLGPAVELGAHLWRKTWRVVATIARPELSTTGSDDFRTLIVSGPEPGSPSAEVKLIVRLRSGLSGPRIVHLGDVPQGRSITRRIQILARDHQAFRILGPSQKGLALSIQPESAEPVKSHWSSLTFTPSDEGEFHEVLKIATDHPEQPTLEVEVRARVIAEEG